MATNYEKKPLLKKVCTVCKSEFETKQDRVETCSQRCRTQPANVHFDIITGYCIENKISPLDLLEVHKKLSIV